jgi:hypothetical protein
MVKPIQIARSPHASPLGKLIRQLDSGENKADAAAVTFTWNGDDEPAATVILAGVTEQLPPAGNPVHANATAPENPLGDAAGYEATT